MSRGQCPTEVSDECKASQALTEHKTCSLECRISGLASLASDLPQEMAKTYLFMITSSKGMLFPALFIRSRLRLTDSLLQRSIDILDDDSLLHIFSLYRPPLLDEDDTRRSTDLLGGEWHLERWWYKLVHVCRRWRYLILASSSGLGLCLVCNNATPIANMLAHSPPLPLFIDYVDKHHDITSEDEEGILLALQHHDRVRWIRFIMPIPALQKVIIALGIGIPACQGSDRRVPQLDAPRNLSSATATSPHPNRLCLPDNIAILYNHHRPRYTPAVDPLI